MPPKGWEPNEESLRLALAGDLLALIEALAETAQSGR